MSVMGFPKKVCMWVGGVSSIQVFLDFWNFFNFAKPLIGCRMKSFSLFGTGFGEISHGHVSKVNKQS